ncbi:MAG: endonuclease/exonuclease/phosphatase family protein [Prolixibacteraceae bacterium]|nr:endonuclease/exonuclease/phosphatase family protein [Prolixibacteraceae bacterium]
MRHFSFPVFIIALFLMASCQTLTKVQAPLTLAFYNVENLFDTIDAPNKIDEEFMPGEPKNWNTERYNKKLTDLSKVIAAIDPVKLPVLLGVCEIENDAVLKDLAAQALLKKAHYNIVWNDGPDERGIDCALLYQPSVFQVLKTAFLQIVDPNDPDFLTREVVYVEGSMNGEIFHVLVNHWPSRRGGDEASEPNRILAASVVKNKVSEIFAANPAANIIIMGDMNDEPSNNSLAKVLEAKPNTQKASDQQLVNLMYDEFEKGEGSYNYRGDWNMIDNLLISGALINKTKGLKSKADNGFVFRQSFMEFKNDQGEISPNRTYGRDYYGGISDHFPIYMILE